MILCANPSAQFQSHQAEIEDAVLRVMRGNRYILGQEVEALEQEFASYIGTTDAIGVANGTDAIELVLRAMGIGHGDEVITVSHTAVATVAGIEAAGATPLLVDVDPDYYTMNPDQLEEVFSPRTKAVMPVHLYGQPADLERIMSFCQKHKLIMVEDVSQAHGATWHGKKLGSFGDAACFSCYPTKNLGAIGDGGLITTSKPGLAKRIKMLREYGWRERYISEIPGRNSRLDELQAAILRIKLRHLDEDNSKRRQLAMSYTKLLNLTGLVLPKTRADAEHIFHLYVVKSRERTKALEGLKAKDIHAGIHYPVPIHKQSAYQRRIRTARSMIITEALASEVLSLPLYPELTYQQIHEIVQALQCFQPKDGKRG
jgi:dTDP-4-amino-4,6-dideoxygalactose transaminase